MRIGLVCPYSVSVPGGVQSQVLGLARELRRVANDVTVFAPTDGEMLAGVTSAGRSLPIRVNGSTARMAPHPSAAWRTLIPLRRGTFDVLHLHEPLAPSITIPVLLAHPAPLVGTFHAAGEQTPYRWLGNSPRRLSRRLDARVAVSDTAAALARRYLGGTYEVLFNGIDARPFVIVNRGPVNTSTVLFLGRDEPRKGLEVLLDAMPLLPAHIELWIAGKGTDHGSLHELHGHNPRIRWLGQLTDDEKIARLRTASVVCVPSLYGESFGIVLLEAMAAGTPIVASDLPAYRTLAHEGGAAHLVPPADPAALANGLRRVLDNTAYANALEAAGVAIAQRYSMQALAEQYLTIYKAVVARRRSQQSPNNRPSAAAGP